MQFDAFVAIHFKDDQTFDYFFFYEDVQSSITIASPLLLVT